jgi:hypothetical protein
MRGGTRGRKTEKRDVGRWRVGGGVHGEAGGWDIIDN